MSQTKGPSIQTTQTNNKNNNKANNERQVFVRLPGGGLKTVLTDNSWSVQHLERHVADVHGIPESKSRFSFATKALTHGTLTEHGVCAEDTIQCALPLYGGGKAKSKGGKSFKKKAKVESRSELIFKEDGQEYAQVAALLGNSRLRVHCADGKERLCTIRGKLVRRAWVSVRDIILVSLREWEDEKCDMIHKYSDDEARNLRSYKELPTQMTLNGETAEAGDPAESEDVIFGIDDDEEINIDSL